MSRRLIALLCALAALSFLYLHFEYFPSRVGPDAGAARAEIERWAQSAGGQSFTDVRVEQIHARNESGIAVAEVEFRQLYYEADGLGQRYTGRGEVDFVRVGRMFSPAWTISQIKLVDAGQTLQMTRH